ILKSFDYYKNVDKSDSVQKFYSILDDLIKNMCNLSNDNKITISEFYTILQSLCDLSKTHQSEDSDDVCIPIVGLSDSVHQNAKYVFLAGLTSDVLPSIHIQLPMLTMSESIQSGALSYQDKMKEIRYSFLSALLVAKDSIYLSTYENDDKGKIKNVSPWLNMFDISNHPDIVWDCHEYPHNVSWCLEHAGGLISQNEPDIIKIHALDDVIRRIEIENTCRKSEYNADFSNHPISEKFKEQYSDESATYSVTQLEKYAKCPFRWYIENHLKLNARTDTTEQNTILGNTIHEIMRRFISESNYFPPSKDNRSLALADILKIATEEFNKCEFITPKWQSTRDRYIGNEQHPGKLSSVIDREINLHELGYTTPKTLVEYKFGDKEGYKVYLSDNEKSEYIKLSGKIDRVRLDSDSGFVVVDYKTGKPAKKSDIDEFKSLQLLLYIFVVNKLYPNLTPKNGEYYLIPELDKVDKKNPFGDNVSNMSSLLESFRQAIFKYKHGIQHGIFSPNVDEDVCKFCNEQFICRSNT
ncbi:MAG TPA: PD-(D/E)XK nuclease family protein, partial [Methanocorpusculum sp.]|nr:PD-(D/E)XK nuclease family protein [Methanocorpusculum sp.]